MIAAYRPCALSDAAAAFVREVLARAAPASPARAKALLFAAGRIATFGESVGLELAAEALLCPAVIERFILCGCRGLSPATRRTLRTNLRALARVLEAHPCPAPTPLPRERAKPPYSRAEIGLFLTAAQALSTPSRQMRASALICLGAGAGIVAGELRYIRGIDVREVHGGLIVRVRASGPPRSRIVPVLCRFQEPLIAAAAFAGQDLVLGGSDPQRKNLTCEITTLFSDQALPRLQAGRLRSTWLHEAAQAIGLGAFMEAAGVTCSQRLGDIALSLPAISEAQLVALLGGSS
ncbi:MAG: hypothetical protein ACRDK4_06510 [Solirubrobacteraceae bacterium]